MLSSLTDTLVRHCETGLRVPQHEDMPGMSLRDALARVPDPRARRGVRYPFIELLHLIVCAVISGTRTLTMITEWTQDAASSAPVFEQGRLPSLATIHRVAAGIDPVILDDIVSEWIRDRAREQSPRGRRVIAIDGKEARGAKNGGGKRVFLMATLDHTTATVIGQESIGHKTNEIPHFAHLMGKIGGLDGTVVTADALHTQREHAEYLHTHGAHYVLTVKNNQRALRERISSQTWSTRAIQHAGRQKKHGRTTTWEATTQPADYVRGHWGIENRLHRVRDVTFDEDRSQVRAGNAAHVMASLRNLAISVHRLAGATNIAAALRAAMRDPDTHPTLKRPWLKRAQGVGLAKIEQRWRCRVANT